MTLTDVPAQASTPGDVRRRWSWRRWAAVTVIPVLASIMVAVAPSVLAPKMLRGNATVIHVASADTPYSFGDFLDASRLGRLHLDRVALVKTARGLQVTRLAVLSPIGPNCGACVGDVLAGKPSAATIPVTGLRQRRQYYPVLVVVTANRVGVYRFELRAHWRSGPFGGWTRFGRRMTLEVTSTDSDPRLTNG